MNFPIFSNEVLTKLSDCSPLLALASLVRNKQTGILQIRSDRIVRQFQINQGRVFSFSSNAKSELPGSLLFKMEGLSSTQYEAFLSQIKTPKQNPWEILQRILQCNDQEFEKRKLETLRLFVAQLPSWPLSDISFQPTPSFPKMTSGLSGPVLFIAATSFMKPEQQKIFCPGLTPSSHLFLLPHVEEELESYGLEPEQKGLLVVVQDNSTIQEVFQGSFLKPDQILSLLFAFYWAGLIEIKTHDDFLKQTFFEALSPEAKALREEMITLRNQLSTLSYYELLGLSPQAETGEIRKKATSLIEHFAAPSNEKLFLKTEASFPRELVQRVAEARDILTDPTQRNEYDRFIESGKMGSFLEKTADKGEEEVLQTYKTLLNQGQLEKALDLFSSSILASPSIPMIRNFCQPLLSTSTQSLKPFFPQIQKTLHALLQKHSQNAFVFSQVGEILLVFGSKESAFSVYSKAFRLDPTDSNLRKTLISLNPKQGTQAILQTLHKNLSPFNFYQLLGISRDSPLATIHMAYRDFTKKFHPDRFLKSEDQDILNLAKEVYKRVVDAFMTLKNSDKRKQYDSKISQPFSSSGALPKTSSEEGLPQTPQGKKYYELAMLAFRQENSNAMLLNLQLGLQVEPQCELFKIKLKELSKSPS